MFFPPPRPPPSTDPIYLIHFVSNGKTLCGIPTPDLKRNERWVEPRGWDAHEANCPECKRRKKT